ncbi:MAG: HEPN domain-containing protein [Lachnospiraceae bacterium]|nr:HEPN domain-containing protein [Lachnospiraceae bacterium]
MKEHDAMDAGTPYDLAMHRLKVAREDLETAKLIFDAGQYRGANNRAYYSIFHSISAVLANEGVAFKRHKDTLGYFNKNYIHEEIFPRDLGRKIVKAEEIRHASTSSPNYLDFILV